MLTPARMLFAFGTLLFLGLTLLCWFANPVNQYNADQYVDGSPLALPFFVCIAAGAACFYGTLCKH